MPLIFTNERGDGKYKFYFCLSEIFDKSPHVHVFSPSGQAKVFLDEQEKITDVYNFTRAELRRVATIVSKKKKGRLTFCILFEISVLYLKKNSRF